MLLLLLIAAISAMMQPVESITLEVSYCESDADCSSGEYCGQAHHNGGNMCFAEHSQGRWGECYEDRRCVSQKCNTNTNTCDSRGHGGGFMQNCNIDDHCNGDMECGDGHCRRPYGHGCREETSYGCNGAKDETCVGTNGKDNWFCQPSDTTALVDSICYKDSHCLRNRAISNSRWCTKPSPHDPSYMICGAQCPDGSAGYGCMYHTMELQLENLKFDMGCIEDSNANVCDWRVEIEVEYHEKNIRGADGLSRIGSSVYQDYNKFNLNGPYIYTEPIIGFGFYKGERAYANVRIVVKEMDYDGSWYNAVGHEVEFKFPITFPEGEKEWRDITIDIPRHSSSSMLTQAGTTLTRTYPYDGYSSHYWGSVTFHAIVRLNE